MKTIFIIFIFLLILPACNKPKKTKGADNAVTRYHKKQIDNVKKAKVTVKNLNKDMKFQEERAKKLKNE
jgi:hypothetical protein